MNIKKEIVGQVDGKNVMEYTLVNAKGMTARIINYGAIVTHLLHPTETVSLKILCLGLILHQPIGMSPT